MNSRMIPSLIATIALFAGCAAHHDAAHRPPADTGPFAQLASLVGPTWVAPFPNTDLTDTQEFEWIFDRKFLRNTHYVSNAEGTVVYEGETIYAWDAPENVMRWWYFNATGGYITGELTIEGKIVTTTGVNHAGGKQTKKVRGELKLGDDEWYSTSFFWKDGEWAKRFTMHFVPAEAK